LHTNLSEQIWRTNKDADFKMFRTETMLLMSAFVLVGIKKRTVI